MTSENSPSKAAAADQPFSHFFSTEAVTSAELVACACAVDDEAGARQRLEGGMRSSGWDHNHVPRPDGRAA